MILPLLPKGTNSLLSMHWRKRKRYKDGLALTVLAFAPNKTRIAGPVRLHYTEYYARVPKDLTNQAGAFKIIEDQIVRMGVLDDDCPEIVTEIKYHQIKVATMKEQRCKVEIEQLETR